MDQMEEKWLGRSAKEAAHCLAKEGLQVVLTPYAGKRTEPGAEDARVMRCTIRDGKAELVVCSFVTDRLQQEE